MGGTVTLGRYEVLIARDRRQNIPQGAAEGIYARVAAASSTLVERKTRETWLRRSVTRHPASRA
jgi:hypothetical protein